MRPASCRRWFAALILLAVALPHRCPAAQVTGDLRHWHRVEVVFTGPTFSEPSDNPNPFLDYRLQCRFTGPSGQVYDVPGFFDTNGSGGASGSKWKCRFAPDQVGTWHYSASFRQGSEVAVSLAANPGTATSFDGEAGSFDVAASDKAGRDFRAPGHGRLLNLGSHYLQFLGSGERWIKGSTDIPENFLGYTGFDNTPNAGHDFDSHIQDWNSGDPDWNGGAGRGIIGALNYLASTGANGIYFLSMNIGGDGNDTYPTIAEQDKTHYDTSKLLQWEIVFTHADSLGIFLHFQLAEAEQGNENYHDGGTLGPERKLYYRELIARFGHHLGIEWDLGEENDYGTAKREQFAGYIKDVDPSDHPVTTHIRFNQMESFYGPLLGNGDFDMTAFQIGESALNSGDTVEDWRARSATAGAPWVISIDEPQTIENDANDEINGYPKGRKDFVWPIYMSGGGGFEWYVQEDGGGHTFDQRVDNWRELDSGLRWTGHALEFMSALPFWEMAPNKSLGSSSAGGTTYTLAKPGEIYALYNRNGGTFTLNLSGASGSLSITWFNPRAGTWHPGGTVSGGSTISLGSPPFGGDAAALVAAPQELCVGDAECNDGNTCTDDDCVAGLCFNTPNSAACDDGVGCTINDRCGSGACAGTDGCPESQVCNASTGICEGSLPTQLIFTPFDDAYVEGTAGFNDGNLKVEAGFRTSYVKFDVSGVSGAVEGVQLILEQDADPSSGITIEVHAATSNGWNESSLNAANAPSAGTLLATFSGAVPPGATLSFDLGAASIPGDGVYSFVISSPVGNDVWFGSGESSLVPVLEVTRAGPPVLGELCPPDETISLASQTKRTKAKVSSKLGKNKISTAGMFTLPAANASAPDVEEVTIRITDAGGIYYQATLPGGSLVRSTNDRRFTFKDTAPFEFGGLKHVKLIVATDLLRVKYRAKAQGLALPLFVGTTSTATLRIGNACHTDVDDTCKVSSTGDRATCR